MKRHWIIDGQYLGASVAEKRWVGARLAKPLGYHFFCAECGRLWAQCPVDGQKHMVWSKPCPNHTWDATAPVDSVGTLYPCEIAGSTYMPWEKEFVAEMPPAVVRYELLVHLRWAAQSGRYEKSVASAAQALLDCIMQHTNRKPQ